MEEKGDKLHKTLAKPKLVHFFSLLFYLPISRITSYSLSIRQKKKIIKKIFWKLVI